MATGEPVTSTFVGRQLELGVLRTRLQAACAGDPQVVLVEGPPGIGKSELVRRFLRDLPDVRVLRASGDESEMLLAYGVVDQLKRSARQPLPSAFAFPGPASAPGLAPLVMGADLLQVIGTIQREGPVVLAVDDVQWADTASL